MEIFLLMDAMTICTITISMAESKSNIASNSTVEDLVPKKQLVILLIFLGPYHLFLIAVVAHLQRAFYKIMEHGC